MATCWGYPNVTINVFLCNHRKHACSGSQVCGISFISILYPPNITQFSMFKWRCLPSGIISIEFKHILLEWYFHWKQTIILCYIIWVLFIHCYTSFLSFIAVCSMPTAAPPTIRENNVIGAVVTTITTEEEVSLTIASNPADSFGLSGNDLTAIKVLDYEVCYHYLAWICVHLGSRLSYERHMRCWVHLIPLALLVPFPH